MSTTVSPSQFTSPDYTKLADLSEQEIMGEMVNPVLESEQGAAPPAPEVPPDLPRGFKDPAADEKPKADDKAKAPADADGAFFQDEQGKWHRPDGEFASADEAADAEAALSGETPTPEGQKAPEAETPAVHEYQPVKTQVTEFAVKASDGTPVTEFPELLFSFKSLGKEFTDVPLDKVVRLAQSGVYNEQLQADQAQFRQEKEQVVQYIRSLEQTNQQWQQFHEAVLLDDKFRQDAQQQYLRENSPEAQLQRQRQQFEQERVHQQEAQQWQQAANYVENRIGPFVEQIGKDNPRVTPQEILGQSAILYSYIPRDRYGAIPYDRLYDVMALVEHNLKPWAEQLQNERERLANASTEKTRRQITAAQIREWKAKQGLARVTSPTGGAEVPGRAAAPSNGAAPRQGSSGNSVDDWMENEFGIEKWRAAR